MESTRSPPINWAYFHQGKNMEELKQMLLCSTLELEATRLAAQEEIKKREDQVINLKDYLSRAITERDEAQNKCQKLVMEKLLLVQHLQHQQLLQQQQQQHNQNQITFSGVSSTDRVGGGESNTSDCEESIVSSPVFDPIPPPPPLLVPSSLPPLPPPSTIHLTPQKPLPEKGKLLQAVMKAGPLLQTLLLAGPLPQWRHPPPPLDSFEIPPVAIPSPPQPPPPPPPPPPQTHLIHHHHQDSHINNSCGSYNSKKRSLLVFDSSDSSTTNTKYQRVLLH